MKKLNSLSPQGTKVKHSFSWSAFTMIFLALSLSSCAKKIHLFDAEKISSEQNFNHNEDYRVQSFFAGDALDYVVFEVDIFNDSESPLIINHSDIRLEIADVKGHTIILDALDKQDIIYQLNQTHKNIKREKKARDITNAIGIGFNLIAIGASSNTAGVDAAIYATDSAVYMMEDARAHKLLVGSLEEQIDYVEEWVLKTDTIPAASDNSWDVLFERRLYEAPAFLVVEINGQTFKQAFNLLTIEQKVR